MKYIWETEYPEFTPNLTPREIFLLGSFGKTYWRNIHSTVTGKDYNGLKEYKKFPFLRDIPPDYMTVPYDQYDKKFNYYKVKVGSTLEEWQKNGWITKHDPYGWVQWYCNFWAGRRIPEEDRRQIDRWLRTAGPNSRFYKRLQNLLRENKDSPAIRQTLLHWGVKYPLQ